MSIIWIVLGIIAIILLAIFWKNRNAIWGGLTLGVIIALVIALVHYYKGSGFDWMTLLKGATLGTIAGSIAELLGIVSKKSI